jgi:hypothetical protein
MIFQMTMSFVLAGIILWVLREILSAAMRADWGALSRSLGSGVGRALTMLGWLFWIGLPVAGVFRLVHGAW